MSVETALDEKDLTDIINADFPLGPPFTEALFNAGTSAFSRLYDETNGIHLTTRKKNPSYIVGRKGSGKTAFLIGGALVERADVVLIQSEHIYTEVNRLSARYAAVNGPLVADSLVHVWEVLLLHAAMWKIATSGRLPVSEAKRRIWDYMSSFGDPMTIEADELLARVSAHMTDALLSAPHHLSFREACWKIDADNGTLEEAAAHTREVMNKAGHKSLYVVVDNLEDLHKHLDTFEDIITGLLRVNSRRLVAAKANQLPFRTRFAFPAELLPRLRVLAANAEKDFLDYLVVRWTAAELIGIAGNRLRTFLDLYHKRAWATLGLPRLHDPSDHEAADLTLRAMLPKDPITNGYGQTEDAVAYVMRHTQLLPRHLIQILNEVIRRSLEHLPDSGTPRASAEDVRIGVFTAEQIIVEGILSTYSYQFPTVGHAMAAIKNHASVTMLASELHHAFNQAGVARVGMNFEEFLDACLSIGALGVLSDDEPDERYVKAEFSYTFGGGVRPVEDRDSVCVHPLFMYQWFDKSTIKQMAHKGVRAVYPYGSSPFDEPDV
jgi:hypothetical protein